MKTVKETESYAILQKRNGRYAVRAKGRKWLNADEKVQVLLEAGLIKLTEPKPAEPEAVAEEAPAEEAAAEEAAEETTEE
ncbi:hypothetical protein IB286_14105 [Spongiibacter sp. KMU-158]|uniref:Uncharacterized protein n=1 Tax=Spongiibacter pelagi TaxID=2760804 RepID=A0A927GXG1_9GAMM|nr:hypothetical protein [Spongiibacter pelagi]MBD2860133.1 hypothetical protein [Spongiibacter pelagi]